MLFSIIIINYNLTNEVKNCINSLIKVANGIEYEIILIDNHSEDESIIEVFNDISKNTQIRMSFSRTEKNLGFGNACNLAEKKAVGDWLFFLNPDTIIRDNIFPKIITEINDSYIGKGIIGLNVNSNKFIDFSAGLFPNYFLEILNVFLIGRHFEAIYVRLKTIFSKDKKLKVQWVMGAALLISKKLFEQVERFDPDYFLYFEEMDLCKKVNDKKLPITYLSNVKIDHLGSVSSKKNYYFFTKLFYKGKLLFLKKHSSKLSYSVYLVISFFTILSQILYWQLMKLKNREKSSMKIQAFNEIIKNIGNPIKINNLTFKK
jgi:hypothetical protein